MDPGDLLAGKYRLVRRLGIGGMAEVWAATNVLMRRDFAIKFILPALADNDEAVKRFIRASWTWWTSVMSPAANPSW